MASSYKEHSNDSSNDGWRSKVPDEVWVDDRGRSGQVDDVSDAGIE